MLPRRRYLLSTLAVVLGTLCLLLLAPRARVNTPPLPAQYSDTEFWQMVTDFSETSGFFRSDNFVSNETSFQHVIPELRRKTKPGGVYIGVGPDQNFTYAIALQPRLAFIIDIRRQNMLLHLLYKSLIQMSDNRAQFLSRLFSRPIPTGLPLDPTAQQLIGAFRKTSASKELFERNYDEVMDWLVSDHHFSLDSDDGRTIEYIYRAFFTAGPDIRYSFPSQYGYRRFPTYGELMLETDMMGQAHSYLAAESNFQILKQMQEENRIVPLVGDFAGEKAIRRLGEYLEQHGAVVTAFYTSNVEYYLFQSEDWRKFLNNVTTLPVDANSTFIRAYFSGLRLPPQNSGVRPETLLDNIPDLLSAFKQGDIRSYEDVVQRSFARVP